MEVWFITGASRGFGAIVAEKTLAEGDAVVAAARKPEQLVARLGHHANLLTVALDVTRAAVERSGHILNVSPIGGISAFAGWGVYGATKFAIEGLSEAMAIELAPLGVRTTVIEPGFFRTGVLDEASLVTRRAAETQALLGMWSDTAVVHRLRPDGRGFLGRLTVSPESRNCNHD